MSKVKEWNKHYHCTVELMERNEVIKGLEEEIRILKRDLEIEKNKLHLANYRSDQEEVMRLKAEKKFKKLNEDFAALEIENDIMRDLVKALL